MVYNGNPHVSPFLIVLNQNDQHQIMSPAGPPRFRSSCRRAPRKMSTSRPLHGQFVAPFLCGWPSRHWQRCSKPEVYLKHVYTNMMMRRMYVCMYVCTYVCMHACMDGCMHACMHGWMDGCMYVSVYVYVYVYVYVCICMYMYVSVSTCIYMYLYVFICIYMYLYVSICIYMYLYVSICIYMYVCSLQVWETTKY